MIDSDSHILHTSGHKEQIGKLPHFAAAAILTSLPLVFATTLSSSQI